VNPRPSIQILADLGPSRHLFDDPRSLEHPFTDPGPPIHLFAISMLSPWPLFHWLSSTGSIPTLTYQAGLQLCSQSLCALQPSLYSSEAQNPIPFLFTGLPSSPDLLHRSFCF